MRNASITRKTAETDISLFLELDGSGCADIQTGCGFLDHMLTLFASHGSFDLTVRCSGDLQVDAHHTTEDLGIALGQAFLQALGDKKGIRRYGQRLLPMDEALVLTAADFSGRAYLGFAVTLPSQKIGPFDSELIQEFWLGFVREARLTLHIREFAGQNTHHIAEAVFKSAARCLKEAVSLDPALEGRIPSTKGVL